MCHLPSNGRSGNGDGGGGGGGRGRGRGRGFMTTPLPLISIAPFLQHFVSSSSFPLSSSSPSSFPIYSLSLFFYPLLLFHSPYDRCPKPPLHKLPSTPPPRPRPHPQPHRHPRGPQPLGGLSRRPAPGDSPRVSPGRSRDRVPRQGRAGVRPPRQAAPDAQGSRRRRYFVQLDRGGAGGEPGTRRGEAGG